MTLPWRHQGTLYRKGGGSNTEGVVGSAYAAVTGMAGISCDVQVQPARGLQQRAYGQEAAVMGKVFFPSGSDVEEDDRLVLSSTPGPNVLKILGVADQGVGWEVEAGFEAVQETVP